MARANSKVSSLLDFSDEDAANHSGAEASEHDDVELVTPSPPPKGTVGRARIVEMDDNDEEEEHRSAKKASSKTKAAKNSTRAPGDETSTTARNKQKKRKAGPTDKVADAAMQPAPKAKRAANPSAKKKENDDNINDAKKRRLEKMDRDRQKLAQEIKENERQEALAANNDGHESEEDCLPRGTRVLASSIKPLAPIDSNEKNKAPRELKRIKGAAAAKGLAQITVSRNAFKVVHTDGDFDGDEGSNDGLVASQEFNATDAGGTEDGPAVSDDAGDSTSIVLSTSKRSKTPQFIDEKAKLITNLKNLNAGHYEPVVRALIVAAANEFEVCICTKNAAPNTAERERWAKKIWARVLQRNEEDYELTRGVSHLIHVRGSRARNEVLGAVREVVKHHYGFKKAGEDSKDADANETLVKSLLEDNRFLYKNREEKKGIFEAKIFSLVFERAFFEGKVPLAVLHPKMFNPIRLPSYSLVAAVIAFVLKEWSTGVFKRATMYVEQIGVPKYEELVKIWNKTNEKVVLAIRTKVYNRAASKAGIIKDMDVNPGLTETDKHRMHQELDGRTGETDSEAENDGENDGI